MSFIAGLSEHDLQRLREIVKRHHRKMTGRELPDKQADGLIEAWGPECAGALARKAVDKGLV